MRAAENRYGASPPKPGADRVGKLSRLRESADEENVDVLGKDILEVFKTGLALELDLVPEFLAPDRDDLGHDAREVGMHDARVEGARRCAGDDVEYRDSQFSN